MSFKEKEMIALLKEGKDKYSYVGIKAEFEAEGTRMDEMIILSRVVRKAGLNLGIKIGGCEAISDLYQSKLLGAEYIIAPMVETPYALSKYIEAKNKVYAPEDRKDVRFLFNLETITTFNVLKEIVAAASVKDGVDGIVFGRVDFAGSMGESRDYLAGRDISQYIDEAARLCKNANLEFVVGGGVAKETLNSVVSAKNIHLSRFETRKVIFNAEALDSNSIDKALENAVKFELLWLKNKQNYYSVIAREDEARIKMLEKRFASLNNK